MTIYFISDLHLNPADEAITALFLNFCDTLKSEDQLYILGDFFNVWIGDEDSHSVISPPEVGLLGSTLIVKIISSETVVFKQSPVPVTVFVKVIDPALTSEALGV